MRPIFVISSAALSALTMLACATKAAPPPSAAEVASVCAGVPNHSLLADLRSDIDGVEIVRQTPQSKPSIERPVGADVHVRAEPGMTAEWLARVMSCQSPMSLPDVTTNVTATPTGFTIAFRSNDVATAREVGRRAKLLLVDTHPTTTAAVP